MIYSRDLWIQLPTKDLYNTQVMMAAVNAAKDMYDKGQKRLDDFYEKYGDFMSPFSKDMDRYGQLVLGITNPIEDMYAQGIDPLRSAEGRALVNRLVNAFPISEFNVMKANAKRGEQYLKDVSDLRSKGLFNQHYQNWLIGQQYGNGTTFENFDSSKGMWTTSPSEFKTIDDIVEPIVKNLTPIYDAEYSKQKNDGFDYYTVSPNRIAATLNDSMPDILKSDVGRYYMDTALKQTGGDPAAADALVKTWMVDRASDHVQIKREENPYAVMRAQEQKEKNVAGYREWLLRTRPPKDSSDDSKANAGSFVYTKQRMRVGVANLLRNSGVGDSIGIVDPNYVTGETAGMIGEVLKDAQKTVVNRAYKDRNPNISAAQKRKDYIKLISFDLGPETFAILMGGTNPQIANHPHARLISVDDNILNRIFVDEDVVAHADGIRSNSEGKGSKKLRNAIKKISNGNPLKKWDKSTGFFGKAYNKAIDSVAKPLITIEGSNAIGQVEKDGKFKEYVKINIYDKDGNNLFPNKNIYYFDSVVSYPNPNYGNDGMVNIYLDDGNELLDRMRIDTNYANFLKTSVKDISRDDLIPQESSLNDDDYNLSLDMLE